MAHGAHGEAAVARAQHRSRRALRAVIGGIAFLLLHRFLFHVSVVRGSSMNPTFVDEERIIVERLSLLLGETPRRGEIVVFECPTNPDLDFVKRVIGLPGDLVRLERGVLYVNGLRVPEEYALADTFDRRSWIVPEEHVFVLGDNRPRSCDSRSFDCVSYEALRGRVRARVWPFERAASF
jgi:signal peptidase I